MSAHGRENIRSLTTKSRVMALVSKPLQTHWANTPNIPLRDQPHGKSIAHELKAALPGMRS